MFEYVFMQRGLVVGILLGIIVPLVGVTIVLRRLSMIGDALSHTSLAGVAGGLIAGINPVAGAAVACVAGAMCVEGVRKRFKDQSELAVAIVLAAGIGLSGFVPNSASFNSFLFGSILTISEGEVASVVGISILALAFCVLLDRELFLMAFDERHARVSGVRVSLINALYVFVVALVVAVAARTVGSLMVSSMMVVPVACALQVARSWRQTCIISSAVGVGSAVLGLILSYVLGLKPGGTIVLLSVALLLAIFVVKKAVALVTRRA